jgi:hypothetical protein
LEQTLGLRIDILCFIAGFNFHKRTANLSSGMRFQMFMGDLDLGSPFFKKS